MASEPRINGEIDVTPIRLIDAKGTMLGVVPLTEAMKQAEAAGLDLVEISPNVSPPVCKILDYGKFKYEAQKKANEARKKQKVISIKEIKLRPTIDDHDLEVKLKNVRKFIEEGDKVKITLRFRGREIAHMGIGMKLLERVQISLGDTVKIEQSPRMDGHHIMVMMLAPK